MTGGTLGEGLTLPCVDASEARVARTSTSSTPTGAVAAAESSGVAAAPEHSQGLRALLAVRNAVRNAVEQAPGVDTAREAAYEPVALAARPLPGRVEHADEFDRRRESVLKEVSDRLQATAQAINVATEGVRSASNSLGSLTRFLGDHSATAAVASTRTGSPPHGRTLLGDTSAPTVESTLPSVSDATSENTARQMSGAYDCLSRAYSCLLQNSREDATEPTWEARTRSAGSGEAFGQPRAIESHEIASSTGGGRIGGGRGGRYRHSLRRRDVMGEDEAWVRHAAQPSSVLPSLTRGSSLQFVERQRRATWGSADFVVDHRPGSSPIPVPSSLPSELPHVTAEREGQRLRERRGGSDRLAFSRERERRRTASGGALSADGEGSDGRGGRSTAAGVASYDSTVPLDLLQANLYPEREGRDQFEAQVVAVLRATLRHQQDVDDGDRSGGPAYNHRTFHNRWFPNPTARVQFMERVTASVISRLEHELEVGHEATDPAGDSHGGGRGLRWWLSDPRQRVELEADILSIVNRRLRDCDDSWGRLGMPTGSRHVEMFDERMRALRSENSSAWSRPSSSRAFGTFGEGGSNPDRQESIPRPPQAATSATRSAAPARTLSDSSRVLSRGWMSDSLPGRHGGQLPFEEAGYTNVSRGSAGHDADRDANAAGVGGRESTRIQEGLANIIHRASRVRHAASRAHAVLAGQDLAGRSLGGNCDPATRAAVDAGRSEIAGGREAASASMDGRPAGVAAAGDDERDERSRSEATSEIPVTTVSARARISSIVQGHLRVLRGNAQRLDDDIVARSVDRVSGGEGMLAGDAARGTVGGRSTNETWEDILSRTPRTQALRVSQITENPRSVREVQASWDDMGGTQGRGTDGSEAVREGELSPGPRNGDGGSNGGSRDLTSQWVVARRRMVNVALERARLQEEIARLRGRRDESLTHLQRLQQEHSRVRQRQVTALSEIVEGLGRTVDAVSSREVPSLERTHAELIAETLRLIRAAPSTGTEVAVTREATAVRVGSPNHSLENTSADSSPSEATTLIHELSQARRSARLEETRIREANPPEVTQDVIETAIDALPQLSAAATLISDARRSLRLRRDNESGLARPVGPRDPDERPRRCSPETIATLPDAPPAAGTGSSNGCVVCLSDSTEGENMCILPCKHIFHRSCVGKWLRLHASCPTCRQEVEPNT